MNDDRYWTDERLDRLAVLLESSARAIQANSESISTAVEAISRAAKTLEILSKAVEENRVNFQEYTKQNDATVASLNAAVERLETVVGYLVRRDGENQS